MAARGAFERRGHRRRRPRWQRFLATFPSVFRRLRKMARLNPVLIFLEATNDTLVRRFSETRRPHPMGRDKSVLEGILEEREAMAPVRAMADEIADTPDMTVHELRQFFMGLSRDRVRAPLVVNRVGFGLEGTARRSDADLMFDVLLPRRTRTSCRRRRPRTRAGDRSVAAFILRDLASRAFIDTLARSTSRFALPHYAWARGKSYLTNRDWLHRRTAACSVMLAERREPSRLANVPDSLHPREAIVRHPPGASK